LEILKDFFKLKLKLFYSTFKKLKKTKMINIIKFNSLNPSPWKNNLGISFQVELSPTDAKLDLLNFDYRISMAQINHENHFSLYPGYKRFLTIIEGSGLFLNNDRLMKGHTIHFNGEDLIKSKPIISNEQILDLGIIYNPQKFNIEFKILTSNKLETSKDKTLYLFPLKGYISFKNEKIFVKDCIKIENEYHHLDLNLENGECVYIKISKHFHS
jgi:environmental stress-induced protein Ves